MSVKKNLTKEVTEQIQDEISKRVTRANPVFKSAVPPMQDLRAQSYVYISKASTIDKAVIVFRSDPKQPDVYLRGGQPYPPRKHYTPKRPYRGGVDLSNVTNGTRGGGTKRAKPLRTHGWWPVAVKKAAKAITG
jgi:hypothetical protein